MTAQEPSPPRRHAQGRLAENVQLRAPIRNPHRRYTRRLGGFSLLETLVAALVLAAGLAVIIGCFAQQLSAISDARDYRNALRLAQRQLDLAAIRPGQKRQSGSGQGRDQFTGLFWKLDWLPQQRPGLNVAVCKVSWQARGNRREVSLKRWIAQQHMH